MSTTTRRRTTPDNSNNKRSSSSSSMPTKAANQKKESTMMDESDEKGRETKPLLIDTDDDRVIKKSDSRELPLGEEDSSAAVGTPTKNGSSSTPNSSSNGTNGSTPSSNGTGGSDSTQNFIDSVFATYFASNPEFYKQAFKFLLCFVGLQLSYLTWGYMQETIMTTQFEPTPRVPDGKFPSAAFCVFSNRFLAVLVALAAVRIKHGAFFANNHAPLSAFVPCALSNTMSSWSQYASLKYVSFPVQTVFKSSKIIPVMIMGKVLQGTQYPLSQYFEALIITCGVAIFSLLSKSSDRNTETQLLGLVFLVMYITFDSFTSQWQSKLYNEWGRSNVDPYQMMLGVNISAICITTAGLIITGDFPIVAEFLHHNPVALRYNIITAITSASGQLCIFYTIKEFGPIVFTIIMTTRQLFSICISAVVFGHAISLKASTGAIMVFGTIFYQIRNKYNARNQKKAAPGGK